MRILLVEDDEGIVQMLKKTLASQHYLVDCADDGQAGWDLAEAFDYDLILLDMMLPKLDGISFCRQLRKTGDRTPILLLTAQDTITNKVAGLDAGADDYLVKPYSLDELLARIRALLRRGSSAVSPVLVWEKLCLDPSKCEVTYNEQPLHLTSKEYAILEIFLRNTNRIFSQSALLDHLWSFEEPPSENTVRAHIKSLRQKLKKAGAETDLIETVYGLGYRLRSKEQIVEASSPQDLAHTKTTPQNPPPKKLDKAENPTQNHSLQQEIAPELLEIWQRLKHKYINRINILEQAVTAMSAGLSEELRSSALREAHTLAGSLGSFGFVEASRLSREIEQKFQTDSSSHANRADLLELITALRQELERLGEAHRRRRSPQADVQEPAQPTTEKPQPRLLIVDKDSELVEGVISSAKARGIQAFVAQDIATARNAITDRPDVVLLDLYCFNSLEESFELMRELAAEPPVPVVVSTPKQSFTDRIKVARLGGRGFLVKPVTPAQVMDVVTQLQQASTPEAKLLLVDDDPQLLEFLHNLLEPWGFKLTLLDDPQQFWNMLEQTVPDLLILDVDMPFASGIDLCQTVRNDPHWSELPILFLSARTDAQTVQRVFTAGADDYVNKPIVGPELVARILNRLERSQIRRKLQKLLGE